MFEGLQDGDRKLRFLKTYVVFHHLEWWILTQKGHNLDGQNPETRVYRKEKVVFSIGEIPSPCTVLLLPT